MEWNLEIVVVVVKDEKRVGFLLVLVLIVGRKMIRRRCGCFFYFLVLGLYLGCRRYGFWVFRERLRGFF